ncbi:hypothetical protein SAV31267_088670 [Streptomyces avermitilis]|uniref:Uncharacterized protein n=1 Tax=Streptomyces avermitilis TaxID=33903 RepID=A0A4D4N4D0_STRAX|nr:hypothetical protein SAV31267_088670 [Streptomyces avermitilis]
MTRVLVVEDGPQFVRALVINLRARRYGADAAPTAPPRSAVPPRAGPKWSSSTWAARHGRHGRHQGPARLDPCPPALRRRMAHANICNSEKADAAHVLLRLLGVDRCGGHRQRRARLPRAARETGAAN